MWALLRAKALAVYTRVHKVVAIRTWGWVRRYDIYVDTHDREACKVGLSRLAAKMGWVVRDWRPYGSRLRPPKLGAVSQTLVYHEVKLATLNVNGLSSAKKALTEWYLRDRGISIVGLQETHRKPTAWPARLQGYQCISEPMEQDKPGALGLTMGCAKRLLLHAVSRPNPYYQYCLCAVPVGHHTMEMVVGNVYIPSGVGMAAKNALVKEVFQTLAAMVRKYPKRPAVLMGDFNMKRLRVKSLCTKHAGTGWSISGGGTPTHMRGKAAIDFMIWNKMVEECECKVELNDISDHSPVVMTIKVHKSVNQTAKAVAPDGWQLPKRPWRPSHQARLVVGRTFADHNKWESLDIEHLPLSEAAEAWCRTTHEVAEEVREHRQHNWRDRRAGTGTGTLSRRAIRAVTASRQAFHKYRQATLEGESAGMVGRLEAEWKQARKEAHKMVAKDREHGWQRYLEATMAKVAKNDMKGYWSQLRRLFGEQRSKVKDHPVRDPVTQEVVVDPAQIAKCWAHHYGQLAADPGNSRDKTYWGNTGYVMSMPQREGIEVVNGDLTWTEVRQSILQMSSGKAAGMDGISKEILMLALGKVEEDSDAPKTAMGAKLFRLLSRIWDTAEIPELFCTALVVSIHKKGDPLALDNYRGISLISVTLKILTKIITSRVTRAAEQRGLLCKEQAGFRSQEECVGQAVTLYEICRRRQVRGLDTWLLFLDISKAYDSVRHELLMAKLEKLGFGGKLMVFLRSIYGSAKIGVMCGEHMEVAELCNGVRQGCPMSPVLFDLFINDILVEPGLPQGIGVPGMKERGPRGLLFADDLVAIYESQSQAQQGAEAFERWALKNELSFGIGKCGLLHIRAGQPKVSGSVRLQGNDVPRVSEYTYLGIQFNEELSLGYMVEHRVKKAERAYWMVRPMVTSTSVPLECKLAVIKGVVIPTLLYGAELWGQSMARTSKGQTLVNNLLRLTVGTQRNTRVPVAYLQREYDIQPLDVMAATRRARLYWKAMYTKTWLKDLVLHPSRDRRWTWVTGTMRWIKKKGEQLEAPLEHTVRRQLVESLGARLALEVWTKSRTSGYQQYKESGMLETKGFWKGMNPRWGRGIRLLCLFRADAVWTVPRLCAAGMLPWDMAETCPACGEKRAETRGHILWECEAWSEQRARMINTYGAVMDLDNENRTVLLLGGKDNQGVTWWHKGIEGSEMDKERITAVARFLQEIWLERQKLLQMAGRRGEALHLQSNTKGQGHKGQGDPASGTSNREET